MENGEIDLIDLYGAFKKTTTYRLLNNAFNLITGNKIWFTAFIVIGLVAGYYLNMNKAPLFKTEMLIESIEINNYVSQNMITGLNSLINEGNYTELEKSGLSEELSSSIQSIETIASEIKIKNEEQNIFKLVLLAYNIDSLDQIEKALTFYLNNNDYSAKLKKENLIQFNSEKDELTKEVNELDSINTLLKKQLKSDQKLIYTSPASISKEKLEANVRIIELDRMIINSNNYHILNGFTPTNSPEPLKGNYPLKCGFLSFILGFIILRIFKR
tara:strand:- start:6165 stop:6980 length:816 start_codon:yes stop_codon:yes gene_type:complete